MTQSPDLAYHPARVLIVDDDRLNRQLLEGMLSPEGFLLQAAASGEEALAIVAQHPPDLILLDIMMPGMDGYQVASKIKGNLATKNIPIIIITALADRNARMRGLSAGAEDFLTKPVDRSELCVRARNLLRLKAYGDYYDKYSQTLEGEAGSRTADLEERTKTLEQQAAVLTEQAALLDLAQDAIVVRDMHSRVVFWNRGAEAMYGWLGAEALGRDIRELLRMESEPTATIEATLLEQGTWTGDAIHHKRDGTVLVVASRWALQRDADGAPVRILTINNDITTRKQADSELLLLTERLWLATSVAKVGVWEWDIASNTFTWDATMFEIYGVPAVVPMPYEKWSAAVHSQDLPAVEATLRSAIDKKGQGSADFRIIRPDGSIRHVSAVESVVLDEHANVTRLIGVSMDVTERKQAEEALEQSRKGQMRFKDDFLSHVSHELRSPLTAIKQFTTILLGGLAGELNKEQREYQQIVLKNIRQLQSMIDDLLEVTRFEAGKLSIVPESVSVSEAVTDVLDTLEVIARAKGVTLSCDLPPDLPSAYADQTRLRQILIILLDNAIKFTSEGGAVSVQARRVPQDPQFLHIDVSDNGCGISPEIIDRVFERLYQVSVPAQAGRKGLGLGLYICKELVTRLGGHIWVKRQPQKGTTFSFTLPVFSLNTLMAPLLKDDKWPAETVALVMVEIGVLDAWPSKESQEAWSHEVRGVIQRCLLPDLDVLLPKMSSGAAGARFYVAAFADEHGTSVLANRLRGQLERLPELKHTGLLSVSQHMLPIVPSAVGASTDDIVTRMASSLEASLKLFVVSNKKVLVVEDDDDVRLGYHVLLKAHNYDTVFAADSVSAVSEAGKHLPDLIILDLGLPSGDGFVVLEALRAIAHLSVIPVIVVSARDLRGNKERALKAGASAFVQKPWNDSELLLIMGQLLGQPQLSLSHSK
jgi:PAS domain S-box-containing protein